MVQGMESQRSAPERVSAMGPGVGNCDKETWKRLGIQPAALWPMAKPWERIASSRILCFGPGRGDIRRGDVGATDFALSRARMRREMGTETRGRGEACVRRNKAEGASSRKAEQQLHSAPTVRACAAARSKASAWENCPG